MKHLIIIAATVAAFAANAQDLSEPLTGEKDSVWTPLVSSIRSYTNVNRTLQHDMLWQVEFYDEKAGKRVSERKRIGVTGCGRASGLTSIVDYNGKPVHREPFEWSTEGDRLFDAIALRVCDVVQHHKPALREL